jgi:2,3-dihydroxybenzoate decarboxylase
MFCVDYRYESSHAAVAGLQRTTLSHSDREKIAHRNAERVLRLRPQFPPTAADRRNVT